MKKTFELFCLSFIALATIMMTSCGAGPAKKVLQSINTQETRYWNEFISKNGINAIDKDGDTLLMWAIEKQNVELVEACLKSKADPNLGVKYEYYSVFPLDKVMDSLNTDILNLMLKNGMKVTFSSEKSCANAVFGAQRRPEFIKAFLPRTSKELRDFSKIYVTEDETKYCHGEFWQALYENDVILSESMKAILVDKYLKTGISEASYTEVYQKAIEKWCSDGVDIELITCEDTDRLIWLIDFSKKNGVNIEPGRMFYNYADGRIDVETFAKLYEASEKNGYTFMRDCYKIAFNEAANLVETAWNETDYKQEYRRREKEKLYYNDDGLKKITNAYHIWGYLYERPHGEVNSWDWNKEDQAAIEAALLTIDYL